MLLSVSCWDIADNLNCCYFDSEIISRSFEYQNTSPPLPKKKWWGIKNHLYLATFTSESTKMKSCCRFSAHFALLIHLQRNKVKNKNWYQNSSMQWDARAVNKLKVIEKLSCDWNLLLFFVTFSCEISFLILLAKKN